MAFREKLPWVLSPLIVNAPMGGFAGPDLAAAVSRAGGLGLIGALMDEKVLTDQLHRASELLNAEPAVKGIANSNADAAVTTTTATTTSTTLPIGVGLLLFALGDKKRDAFLDVLSRYNPAVIWMFAEVNLDDYAIWTREIRRRCPYSQVWIQICSVSAAVKVATEAKPDVLVMQGADAGGHGWEKGAGIVSLVPETRDALAREGLSVGVVASGGIADARGVAAALSLGADGVVMGTRFLASKEVVVHPLYQRQVLEASDGGQATVRHRVFDQLNGPNIWPGPYDGRAIRSVSWQDATTGVAIDEIRERHAQGVKGDDRGFGNDKRAVVWSGTGVGLVNDVRPAADILQSVRAGVKAQLEHATSKL